MLPRDLATFVLLAAPSAASLTFAPHAGAASVAPTASALAGASRTESRVHAGQGFESRIDASGLILAPVREGEAWSLVVRTAWVARGSTATVCEPTSPRAGIDGRDEFDRGVCVEWFAPHERGIEQGWTFAARPAGEGDLVIAVRFAGDLSPKLAEDGKGAKLVDGRGSVVMNYSGLFAYDARGAAVPARMEPGNGVIEIRVDDRDALYPLVVDPLLTGPAWTYESNQAASFLGESVATAGDVNGDGFSDVIVGAPFYETGQTDEGRALVFHGSASGIGAAPAWTFESNQGDERLGTSVSTAGDVNGDGYSDVIVGAPFFTNGQNDEGRAFVFHGSATGLSATPNWTAESDQAAARFGSAVACAGDVNGDGFGDVLVGAPFFDGARPNEGRVSLYLGSASGLALVPTWTVDGLEANGQLGHALAWAGDVNADGFSDVLVSQRAVSPNNERVRVYLGSALGLGATPASTLSITQTSSGFGNSVSTAGDVNGDGRSDVIIGAPFAEFGVSGEGAAFVFHGWAFGVQASYASELRGNAVSAFAGRSVSTAGDVDGDGYADVIVGANSYGNGQGLEGRIQVYRGGSVGVVEAPAWTYEPDLANTRLGNSVALAGDVDGDGFCDVIAGASEYDGGQLNEGRAYVFLGSTWDGGGLTTFHSANPGQKLGGALEAAGDVDGDGYADVAIGSDNTQLSYLQRAYIGRGPSFGLFSPTAYFDTGIGAQAGASLGSGGDSNGDGYDDVLVGSPGYSLSPGGGRVDLVRWSSSLSVPVSDWVQLGPDASADSGRHVSGGGDVNGDGLSDVLVASPQASTLAANGGRVECFLGAPSPASITSNFVVDGAVANSRFGLAVAFAGDVNRDGFTDVLYTFHDPVSAQNAVRYHPGSPAGVSPTSTWQVSGPASSGFGERIRSAGDVNGDGRSDFLIAATVTGAVELYLGTGTGPATTPAWSMSPVFAPVTALGCAGDVNNDGLSDVLIGSADTVRDAQLFLGTSTGLATTSSRNFIESEPSFGDAVAGVGDVDGDGFADYAIGMPLDSTSGFEAGGYRLYRGNGNGGRVVRARQLQSDGVTPLPRGGRADREDLVRVKLNLISVLGRVKLRAQYEVKTIVLPFTGTALTEDAAAVDTAAGGSTEFEGTFDATQLLPGSPHHWRARAKFELASSPLLPRGRWIHTPINGWNETDFYTPGLAPQQYLCPGDGSGTACPCANNSPLNQRLGCLNSLGLGGKLRASGAASIGADDFVLLGSQMPNSSALYFQSTALQSGGAGAVFGDGLRCTSGSIIRLGAKTNVANASQYPELGDPQISVKGLISGVGTRYYQVWYRNAAVFCTASTFNLSNAARVAWGM